MYLLLSSMTLLSSIPLFYVGVIDNLEAWLASFFNSIFQNVINFFRDTISQLFQSFVGFLKAMVLTVFDMFKDIFYFIFDALLSLLTSLLNGLGSLFSALNFTNALDGMPSEVLNIIGLVGLGQCMAFIVTALIIRITLQLIPFTRLGS